MTSFIPPVSFFIFGAVLFLFIRGNVLRVFLLLIPAITFMNLVNMPEGTHYTINFLDFEIIFCKVDKMSKVFGYIFVIMTFAGNLFSIHLKTRDEHIAALLYAGGSLGVVFAGDYFSLFVFWELMAVASTYLIWARKTKAAKDAGFRYVIIHFLGGQFLFAGIIIYVVSTGSISFGYLGLNGPASWLILLGFILNAAVPPFSAWLSDAYPESTVTGTVFLSAFTTKTAVYVLARAFPGEQILMWAGIVMVVYGIVYALIENDMRRVLSYSIMNQVGFMITGIGIGTTLAINGAVSHAFAHILYKALLMMSAGAVLFMTNKSKCTELGGLYKTMPITLILCCVGAASISGFPLTGGFTTKSMIIAAAGSEHLSVIWHLLMLASAGVFLHAGIKFPYFVFFAKDSGLRPKEPPINMLLAMGLLSILCILVGVWPEALYRILPYPVDFVPYTGAHVVGQLQILMFSALAFFVLLKFLKRTETISLDTDWFYRKATMGFLWLLENPLAWFGNQVRTTIFATIPQSCIWFSRNPLLALKVAGNYIVIAIFEEQFTKEKVERIRSRIVEKMTVYPGNVIRYSHVGTTVIWVMGFLLAYLIIYIVSGRIVV
ncbi:MAG: Na(+)/H(+) antiporter subunit D [Candidatus Scalinduaceae bacterium]